jgi:hypothetical protein
VLSRKTKQLARFSGQELFLNRLSSLTAQAAAELAHFDGDRIELGIQNLSPEVAHELATFGGKELHLTKLESLSTESASQLSRFRGAALYLDQLPDPSPDVKKALKAYGGKLLIGGARQPGEPDR